MKYYLGIDGGGTHTTAVVTDENGKAIAKKTGKTINFCSVGMEYARKNLESLMDEIYSETKKTEFDGAFIGCSALDNEADENVTNELCSGIINAKKLVMHSDVYIALKSLGDIPCPAVVICGTGSMAIGEDSNANTVISGGWGHVLGDEGSAYSIALSALKKCCFMCDKGEKTLLLKSAEKYFGVDNFRKAIDVIYSSDTSKDVIAGFAKEIGTLAQNGDEDCKKIISSEAVKAAETVKILLDKIKACNTLGLYGGVFQHNKAFESIFTEEIKKYYPDIETKLLTLPPEESAAKLARSL